MNSRWPTKSLAEACEIRPPKAEAARKLSSKDLVSFLPMEDLGIDQKMVVAKQAKRLSEVNGSYTYFADGDVLLAKITPCFENGKLGIAANLTNGVGFGSSEYIVFRPRSGLEPDWLYYFLSHDDFRAKGEARMGGAVGHKRVAKEFIESFPISVPPIVEQRRIVRILDEALAGIATGKVNAEKNLHNARALLVTGLQREFARCDYERRAVSQIAQHSLGKMLDKAKNRGVRRPYLRNLNVRWFTFDLSDLLEMPFLESESEKYTAAKGDVLVCEGGYPGRAAIWNEDYPIHFQKALHRVRFHDPECGKWFVYYLFAVDASGELRRSFSGTGIQHFTGEALARFEIPLPPPGDLRGMVAAFDDLSVETARLEAVNRRKLAALDELKQGLLREAFSGGL